MLSSRVPASSEIYVASRATVGLLLGGMRSQGISEVWGLHGVPFAQGSHGWLPLCGSSKVPNQLAWFSICTSPGFPGEAEVRIAAADSEHDQNIGRPLLISSSDPPDLSTILDTAPGFSTLTCHIGAPDQEANRHAALYGDPGAGEELVPIRLDELTMVVFLALAAFVLERDLRALAA